MRLAVNLRLYVKGKIGGMENYVRHMLRSISASQHETASPWTVFAHTSQVEHVREFTKGAMVVGVSHETAAEVIRDELNRNRYDLLFCPLLVLEPLRLTGVPSIVTIPDIQHEFFPEFFDHNTLTWRREHYGASVRYADVIFTISEFSKSTIVEKFHLNPAKVVVIGLDVDAEFRAPVSAEADREFHSLNLPDKYIYYPANFWKHKNHSILLQALKLLTDNGHPDLHLVLTGAPDADMRRVAEESQEFSVSTNVHFLGYQPRWLLPELYRHSRSLVFVSRFEGFGIPILEAFHTDTPVVTAASTSCPEVAGNAAVFVDEENPADVARGIRSVLEDEELRRHLIAEGRLRAAEYSWQAAVDTSLEIFRKAAQGLFRTASVTVSEYPKVGIVTPTYNMGHFLEETIESVLSQDYPHIDYVMMDGGSTDGTRELLAKYEGRVRYVSAPDEGQADAINKGFALCSGEMFAFLNADDTYLPGAVGTAASWMRNHEAAGVVYGDAYYVTEDGARLRPYPTRSFEYQSLARECYICQPAAFMRREVFAEVGGMNKRLQTALDYDLWIRIAKKRPLVKFDGYLATSRIYKANKTISKRATVFREIIDVVKQHYGYVPYDWLYGYAAYLTDGKDQILEPSTPSPWSQALALALGFYHNPTHPLRYWRDWSRANGLVDFRGRWDDGWISAEYEQSVEAKPGCDRIVIDGRHLAPIRNGITLRVFVNDRLCKTVGVREHGPFRVELPCELGPQSRTNRLVIRANSTFRPVKGGDMRRLSCIIDRVAVDSRK